MRQSRAMLKIINENVAFQSKGKIFLRGNLICHIIGPVHHVSFWIESFKIMHRIKHLNYMYII